MMAKRKRPILAALLAGWACLCAASLTVAQTVAPEETQPYGAVPAEGHREAPDDEPIVVPERERATSPRAVIQFGAFRSVQVNVNASGDNIIGDAANEPSIAVDPTDRSRIAIGWRQFDSVLSNFRQAGRAYSADGGETWTFPGVLQPGIFRSDPVLDYDAEGTFYYNSLQANFTAQYFISTDGGQIWGGPIPAFGGDKLWSTIDRTSGIGHGNIYNAWSPAAGCCGNRLFTRSTDGGFTFMEPITLPASPMWGTLTVAPNGNLYVCGMSASGTVPVMRSSNAQNSALTPSFTVLPGADIGGVTRASIAPNPGGLLGQMWIASEPEGGPRPNNVYLLGSVDPPDSDVLDVMFARSTDGGASWEPPIRINDDPIGNGARQWFGTMSVAPSGRIDAVWNDTRADPTGALSQLYYANSNDGGVTWSPNVAVSPQFDPALGYPNQNKLGDYYHAISHDAFVYVAYAATFTGGQDVYFLRIPIDCNENGVLDPDDIAAGTSEDCNFNDVPDECDRDCDDSGAVDDCEVAAGSAVDCDGNGVPDSCDVASGATDDCNTTGVPDSCELAAGTSPDCNHNGVPDECDIESGFDDDCDFNGIPDECDSAALALLIAPPQDALSCTGVAASFTVSAPGATAYQWRFGETPIDGATDATLIIDSVALADEGGYTCAVTFGCVVADSAAAELRVVPPTVQATLLSPSSVQTCTETGTGVLVLAVAVDDADGVLYQWSLDDEDLTDGGRISGAQSPVLVISQHQPADSGIYTCRVWNICIDPLDGDSVSAEVQNIDPQFTAPPMHACAELGATVVFHAEVIDPLPFALRWYEGTTALQNGGRFSGTSSDTLQLANVVAQDSGRRFRLRAVVLNPVCNAYSPEAILVVQPEGGCSACPAPGDFDADGDYDLVDMQQFVACFGADVTVEPGCACANVNGGNLVVDNADWTLLEQLLSGPVGP